MCRLSDKIILNAFLLLLFFSTCTLHGQHVIGEVGLHNFFDNYEFGNRSTLHPSNTMAGVHVAPKFGLNWQTQHRLLIGFDAMREYGSRDLVNRLQPIAYYEYDNGSFLFKMGAFPRRHTLDHYPRLFFADSILNYRPVINGLFWGLSKQHYSFNAWLDWTSRRTAHDRETFLVGWSGKYHRSLFYAQHLAYLYHYAYSYHQPVGEHLHDYALLLSSLGIDLSQHTFFDLLTLDLGLLVGLERNRDVEKGEVRTGLYSEALFSWRGLELKNTLYLGKSQQRFFEEGLYERYWGDRLFRQSHYNRSDLTLHMIRSAVAKVRISYSLHLTQEGLFHQQAIYATFDLDNFRTKRDSDLKGILSGWKAR